MRLVPPAQQQPIEIAPDLTERQKMIELVQQIWYEDVYKKAVPDDKGIPICAPLIKTILRSANGKNYREEIITPEKSLAEIYGKLKDTLLILGAPGAGKTFKLIELMNALAIEATVDQTKQIPVIFVLSSWATKQEPLANWLVDELFLHYGVAHAVAKDWLAKHSILPLLDGLDEMPLEKRAACIKAIDEFRKDHHNMKLVITSRIEDFDAIKADITTIPYTLELQPLQLSKALEYLADESYNDLRNAIENNPILQELAQTLFTLNIMKLTYAGNWELPLSHIEKTKESHLHHLFEEYIQQHYDAYPATKLTLKHTRHYTQWLGQQMKKYDKQLFLIEEMQPHWLNNLLEQQRFTRGIRLAIGLAVGLAGGLVFGLAGGLVFGLVGGLVFGLAVGLIFGLDNIKLLEKLRWSWPAYRQALQRNLAFGLASGVIFGLIIGLAEGLEIGLEDGLAVGLIVGLAEWLAFGLAVGLAVGLEDGLVPQSLSGTREPNEGINNSRRNALMVIPIYVAVYGLAFGLAIGLAGRLAFGLAGELAFSLVFGLAGGLGGLAGGFFNKGGLTVLQHTILRRFLKQAGSIPTEMEYSRFLETLCAMRILVRVGGGYKFVHRMLHDHIIKIDTETQRNSEEA